MEITLKFDNPFNHSLQVGDTIWYTDTLSSGGYSTASKDTVNKLGTVEFISNQYRAYQLKVSVPAPQGTTTVTPPLNIGAFIMFSKNNIINLGDVSGYYAEVKLENNSTEKIELFAVGSEISQSSK